MKLYPIVIAATFLLAAPAQAATIGLACPEGARVMLTATDAEMTPIPEGCEPGFVASHGYWSLAASEDAVMSGASGGYSTQDGADAAAVAACVAKGAESCAVTANGYDDGTGPVPDLTIAEPEPEMAATDEMTAEEEAVLEDAVEADVTVEPIEVAEPSPAKVEVLAVLAIVRVTPAE